MFDAVLSIRGDIKTIENRIIYLESHPDEIRTEGNWNYESYSKCTHLELLKYELIMLLGVLETLK